MFLKFPLFLAFAASLMLLGSCESPSSSDDDSGYKSSQGSYAQIIVVNRSTQKLMNVKIGSTTYDVNLTVGGTSGTLNLPVYSESAQWISAQWKKFDNVMIKSYVFRAGTKYTLTFYATTFMPLHGSLRLENVSCWVDDPAAPRSSSSRFIRSSSSRDPLTTCNTTGYAICKNQCVSLNYSSDNCGRCGHACRSGTFCLRGICK